MQQEVADVTVWLVAWAYSRAGCLGEAATSGQTQHSPVTLDVSKSGKPTISACIPRIMHPAGKQAAGIRSIDLNTALALPYCTRGGHTQSVNVVAHQVQGVTQ